jgi:hypothetical protein
MGVEQSFSEPYWFAVNCLAVTSAVLPFLAIERSLVGWSLPGYALLIGAGLAGILMWVLIAVAVLNEKAQAQDPNGPESS